MLHVAVAFLLALGGRQAPIVEIPFELVGNHIYIKGTAGNRPISVLLDSGAGASVMDSGLAEKWNLTREKSGLPVRGAGGKTMPAETIKDFKVKLTGTQIEQPIFIGIPLEPLKNLEGRPLEAVIGFEFFRKYVVQIDYANAKLRLYSPETFTAASSAKSLPIHLVGNHPHLNGEVEVPGVGRLPVEVMVDTGAGLGVGLSGKIVDREKLDSKLPPSPQIPTGAGVGGATTGRNVRLDALSIGGFRIDRPLASLDLGSGGATGTAAAWDVLVGGDVMRRFTVTFDYSRSLMYLEPNSDLGKPFTGDQTGLYLRAEGEDLRSPRVMYIVDRSPAQEAGVKVGDKLVDIDGKPAAGYELYQIKQLLRETDKTWRLNFDRDGKTVSITLKGRPLVP